MLMNINLSEEAKLAEQYINNTNQHIFLTGKAGTGKTTFLKHIINTTYKNTVVAAPTGIAAINAGGVTLHSLLQLPFGCFIPQQIPQNNFHFPVNTPNTLFSGSKFSAQKRQLIREIELLIIDEVSMLRADLLDCIDHTLRYLRKRRDLPFGGVQVLFIGDLMQLPPVIKSHEQELLAEFYPTLFFFDAHVLRSNPPIKIELKKIYRQSDQNFVELLNRFRNNQQTSSDIELLNEKYDKNATERAGYIHLTTHNHKADRINQEKMNQLPDEPEVYTAFIRGNFPENMYPTASELEMKVGAQVMFIKNDPTGQGRFYNGKIGKVIQLEEDSIKIKCEDEDISVTKYNWENTSYTLDKETNEIEEKQLGAFEQFPLKPAWAVTVHKSQGLTFEKAILDLSGTFAAGQLYVALSRLTSLDGLVLSSPIPTTTPSINEQLKIFINEIVSNKELSNQLKQDSIRFILHLTYISFDFSMLLLDLKAHRSTFNKDENRSLKQKFLPWTEELIEKVTELEKVGKQFINQIHQFTQKNNPLIEISERMSKAKAYFSPILEGKIQEIDTHIRNLKKQKQAKTYSKELKELLDNFYKYQKQISKLDLLVQKLSQNNQLTKQDLSFSKIPQQPKTQKIPTHQITYELFKSGKTIEEIAEERELTTGTITGHLAKYVELGELDVADFVPIKYINKIIDVLAYDYHSLSELKEKLPQKISYDNIKMVMAHKKYMDENS